MGRVVGKGAEKSSLNKNLDKEKQFLEKTNETLLQKTEELKIALEKANTKIKKLEEIKNKEK